MGLQNRMSVIDNSLDKLLSAIGGSGGTSQQPMVQKSLPKLPPMGTIREETGMRMTSQTGSHVLIPRAGPQDKPEFRNSYQMADPLRRSEKSNPNLNPASSLSNFSNED